MWYTSFFHDTGTVCGTTVYQGVGIAEIAYKVINPSIDACVRCDGCCGTKQIFL
jgi:hypothetical protein